MTDTMTLTSLPRLGLVPAGAGGTTPSTVVNRMAPGQLLEATVVSTAARGTLIDVQGQRLVARTGVLLLLGERLTLRVENVERRATLSIPTLSIIARAIPARVPPGFPVARAIVSGALRHNLPVQVPLADAVRSVLSAVQAASTQSRPPPPAVLTAGAEPFGARELSIGGVRLTAAELRVLVTHYLELTQPDSLRARLLDAGHLLEAKLLRTNSAGPPRSKGPLPSSQSVAATARALLYNALPPGLAAIPASIAAAEVGSIRGDLKAVFNRLRIRARAVMREGPNSSSQERRPIDLIDGALARLRVLQVGAIAGQEDANALRWNVELPVLGPNGHLHGIEVEVRERPGSEPESEAESGPE